MSKIGVYYGSASGNCERIAQTIADKLGAECHNVTELTADAVANYDVLILGSSTWGSGDLQDDWYDKLSLIETADLSGKKVGLFGCGDSSGFGDTFCNAMGTLYEAAKGAGATIIGKGIPTDGYNYIDSTAVVDGAWVGCACDEENEPDQTEDRIDVWVDRVKKEL